MKALLAATGGGVGAAVCLVVAVVPLALIAAQPGGGSVLDTVPPAAADIPPTADIPPAMLVLYIRAAQRCPGLAWTALAAIGKVETDHGRGSEVSSAGAEGPMQFMPSTWRAYGVDGDGDGVASIWDAADAVPAAADYLCANGGGDPATLASAIFAYNHDPGYVRLVLEWARRYAGAEPSAA